MAAEQEKLSTKTSHNAKTMVVQTASSAYRDHSHITDDDKDLNVLLDKADTEGVKGTDQTFPVKLHQLLSGSDEDGFSHIVSWQPHGRSFIVKKHDEFVEKVLPW
jgi:HSF-type DNA-binding